MKQSDIEVSIVDWMGSDLSVVNAARVSFDKVGANFSKEQNEKLINYLAKHKHFSPFNHSFITVRVKAPVFVARQLVKHKFMPWNEISRRYVDSEPEFYFPEYWRARADNVKQGSSEEHLKGGSISLGFTEAIERAYMEYVHMIKYENVCPEQARMVLPQNMMTEWVWSGTLGAFADMLKLRLDPHTQYESRIVALRIKEIIEERFPVSLKALLENK